MASKHFPEMFVRDQNKTLGMENRLVKDKILL